MVNRQLKRHSHYKQSLVLFHANDLSDYYNFDYNTSIRKDNNQNEIQGKKKLVYLVIFFIRNQPASLDMLQNELVKVHRRIREPCYIKERSLSDKI